jgi:hypothetical protein
MAGGNLAVAQVGTTLTRHSESAILNVQQKVESLYQQGEYKRAFFIYRNELVPIGDKYAQYMVGFMYLSGIGIEKDPVRASAWYRLAAERSYPEFITIRDQLLGSLTEIDLERSDDFYQHLRMDYSDIAIIMRLVRQDLAAWDEQKTGSRLTQSSGPVTVVDPQSGEMISRTVFERKFRQRAAQHLDLLAKLLPDTAVPRDIRKVDIDELQVAADRQLAVINDRTPNTEVATDR